VSGTVKDASGAVLHGAQVVLQPTSTTVATDAQGNFNIPNIKPGTYTVTITYIGFSTSTQSINVTAGKVTPLNATLTIGFTTQSVVVRTFSM
jgi:asparagine N-glycosylation enzyme membrane subunit Stt3